MPPQPAPAADPDLAQLYGDTRRRLSELLVSLDADEVATPVPACPGWSVADVSYHLLAVVEDVMAGRLTKPPSDAETAEQVRRHRGKTMTQVVEEWDRLGPQFEPLISSAQVWPAVLDVASHEHDIRGALGRPGARDADVVRIGAEQLVTWMRPPVPMRIVSGDFERRVGPDDSSAPELVLRTSHYDTFRWRLGRRSRAQMQSADWSSDPGPVLDHLFVFGPSPHDITE